LPGIPRMFKSPNEYQTSDTPRQLVGFFVVLRSSVTSLPRSRLVSPQPAARSHAHTGDNVEERRLARAVRAYD